MIDLLVQSRLTALPALVFLVVLPLFLRLPARHTRALFLLASCGAIYLVAGPVLGTGLLVINVAGWFFVELLARLPARRTFGLAVGVIGLHAGYWACFTLPVPDPFARYQVGDLGASAYYILFAGIGLTFFRLITYFKARLFDPVPPLSLGDYLLYMLYYPQFRHGPIERAYEFVPRLRAARDTWTPGELRCGLARIGIGIAGLVVLRGLLSVWAHYLPEGVEDDLRDVFDDPHRVGAIHIVLLVHLPAVLLYLLESSYAHIQLGVSRAFGVTGSENFRYPFLATNPRELWHRWNITLFHWLRDYVYKPLRGRAGRKFRRLPAIVLTFVYCGLLHGPQARCVIWGLWMGCGLAAYVGLEALLARRRREAATEAGAPPFPSAPARQNAGVGARLRRHAGRFVARLLVYEWFCIGVTIMADAESFGVPVLRRWLEIATGGLLGG